MGRACVFLLFAGLASRCRSPNCNVSKMHEFWSRASWSEGSLQRFVRKLPADQLSDACASAGGSSSSGCSAERGIGRPFAIRSTPYLVELK
jgi:hypothetical protein